MANSTFSVVSAGTTGPELGLARPSMDEWILATVQEHGGLTLNQLTSMLPQPNWSQVFLLLTV